MKLSRRSLLSGFVAVCFHAAMSPDVAAYTVQSQKTLSASAVIGGGSSGTITFNIPTLLPILSFFGKDIIIPVEITEGMANSGSVIKGVPSSFSTLVPGSWGQLRAGVITASNMDLVYQLFDAGGNSIGGEQSVPIVFRPRQNDPNAIHGSAVVPLQNLVSLRLGGKLTYYFRVFGTTVNNAGVPFEVSFTRTMDFPVSQEGSLAIVPDTNVSDGNTALSFAPQALTNAGTLRVRQEELLNVPAGPGGVEPVVAYSFDLEGTRLQRDAQLTLSYATNPDGSLKTTAASAQSLAPYWLKGSEWLVLGPRVWDSVLHTISFRTTHLSTFALFPTGANAPADLRPRRRILTPNGDGQNDTIDFSGIGSSDGVKIYDVRGRRVRDLPAFNQVWDGRDDDGDIVESGVYIYQYTAQGERVSGTILIAK